MESRIKGEIVFLILICWRNEVDEVLRGVGVIEWGCKVRGGG